MPLSSSLDVRVLRFLRTTCHSPGRDRAVARFSTLGEHGGLWLVLGVVGALMDPRGLGSRRAWRRGVVTVLLAYAVNQAIKFTVLRRRPELPGLPPLVHTMSSRSFPSAHATTSFAAARAYRGLLPGWLLYAVAGAIALSRPWLGVHYPSDVVAGAVLGTAVAEARGQVPLRPEVRRCR